MGQIQFARKEGDRIFVPVYDGRTVDQMPKLVGAGQVPINTAQLMDVRNLAVESGDEEWIQQVCYNYFDTGVGAVYDKEGNIKINPDSSNLRKLNPVDQLENFAGFSAINLERGDEFRRFADLPDEIDGVQLLFTPKEIEEYTGRGLTEAEVLKNKFWLAFANGDEERLGKYVQNVYSKSSGSNKMRIWVTKRKSDFEAEKLWRLIGFGDGSDVGSNLSGQRDYPNGRLVGITNRNSFDLEGLVKP